MTRRAGFTLVEVLLALALVLLVTGLTFGMLIELGARERDVSDHAERLAQTATLIESVERAIAGSMVASGDGGAGISGGEGALHITHRGVAPSSDGAPLDMVTLDLRWDRATGDVECTHAIDAGGSSSERIVSGVSWLSVRFHDGAAWRGSYDSASAGSLPTAIELAVWFGPPPEAAGIPPDAVTAPPEPGAGSLPFAEMFADEFEGVDDPGAGEPDAFTPPTRAPDRWVILAVPDAPRAQGELAG